MSYVALLAQRIDRPGAPATTPLDATARSVRVLCYVVWRWYEDRRKGCVPVPVELEELERACALGSAAARSARSEVRGVRDLGMDESLDFPRGGAIGVRQGIVPACDIAELLDAALRGDRQRQLQVLAEHPPAETGLSWLQDKLRPHGVERRDEVDAWASLLLGAIAEIASETVFGLPVDRLREVLDDSRRSAYAAMQRDAASATDPAVYQDAWVRQVPAARLAAGSQSAGKVERWDPATSPRGWVSIRGEAGIGKSWLVHAHVAAVADAAIAAVDAKDDRALRVPVAVDCASFARGLEDPRPGFEDAMRALEGALLEQGASDSTPEVLRAAYAEGAAVIALDALDEAPPERLERVRIGLAALAKGQNQVIVTTRPIYDPGAGTQGRESAVYELIGFTEMQATAFARAWLGDDRADKVTDWLLADGRSSDLWRRPLIMRFLCTVAGELPGSPEELYDRLLMELASGRLKGRGVILDANARLTLLEDALAQLAEGWRGGAEDIDLSALEMAMKRDADADTIHEVISDFRAHGLLVPGPAPGFVRLAHPTLRAHLMARHVGRLPESELRVVVNVHRWFDPGWDDILVRATPRRAEPSDLVRAILDFDRDPWFEQRLMAARACAAGWTVGFPEGLLLDVLAGVTEALRSARYFDQARAVESLEAMVLAGIPAATDAARGLRSAERLPNILRRRLRRALARMGDSDALDDMRATVTSTNVSADHLGAAAEIVLRSDGDRGRDVVVEVLSRSQEIRAARVLAQALRDVPQSGAAALLDIVQKPAEATTTAARAAAEALAPLGGNAVEGLLAVANDPHVRPVLAAHLAIALSQGERASGVDALAKRLVLDPNVPNDLQADLIVELLSRDGDPDVVSAAIRYLSRASQPSARVVGAVARSGPEGLAQLVQQAQATVGQQGWFTLVHSLLSTGSVADSDRRALVGTLREMVGSRYADPPVRRAAAHVLVAAREEVAVDLLAALLEDPKGHISGLVNALAVSERSRLTALALGVVRRLGTADLLALPPIGLSGPHGRGLLEAIIVDDEFDVDSRLGAAIALAAAAPSSAGAHCAPLLVSGGLAGTVRQHLVAALAGAGAAEVFEIALAEHRSSDSVYGGLYHLLAGGATIELADLARALRETTDEGRRETARKRLKVDDALLARIGVELETLDQDQVAGVKSRIYQMLELRVGERLAMLMLPTQLDDFERASADGDDAEKLHVLEQVMPDYRLLVREQFDKLVKELAADPDAVVRTVQQALPEDPLDRLAELSRRLRKWVSLSAWHQTVAALEGQAAALLSPEAAELLDLAARNCDDDRRVMLEAHLYVLEVALGAGGLAAARRLFSSAEPDRDMNAMWEHYSEGNSRMLGLSASLVLKLKRDQAPGHFYKGIALALQGEWEAACAQLELSGRAASSEQLTHGTGTLGEAAGRFGWPDKQSARLVEALNSASIHA